MFSIYIHGWQSVRENVMCLRMLEMRMYVCVAYVCKCVMCVCEFYMVIVCT